MVFIPAPDKIIRYPIVGDDDDDDTGGGGGGGRLFIFGDYENNNNNKIKNIQLFCGGFPDDPNVFLPFANRLKKELDIECGEGTTICGVTCLAGYDNFPDQKWTEYKKDGYTFNEWAITLRTAAKTLRQLIPADMIDENVKYTTIFHDWGVVAGSTYTNRALAENDMLTKPDQIVYFDVLPDRVHSSINKIDRPKKERKSIKSSICEYLYRFGYATVFYTRIHISKWLAIIISDFISMTLYMVGLSPVKLIDIKTAQSSPFKPDRERMTYMMFPYYNIIKLIMGAAAGSSKMNHSKNKNNNKQDSSSTSNSNDDDQDMNNNEIQFHLPELDKVPVLYMYGKEKNASFHDEGCVNYIKSFNQEAGKTKTKSNAIGVENAGHWLYVQQEDQCIEEVKKFILG